MPERILATLLHEGDFIYLKPVAGGSQLETVWSVMYKPQSPNEFIHVEMDCEHPRLKPKTKPQKRIPQNTSLYVYRLFPHEVLYHAREGKGHEHTAGGRERFQNTKSG